MANEWCDRAGVTNSNNKSAIGATIAKDSFFIDSPLPI